MTARHVVDPPGGGKACHVRVHVDGTWIPADRWVWWYNRSFQNGRTTDVATLKLAAPSSGHVFSIRRTRAPLGTNLAMVGHPLGHSVSLTQGRIIARRVVEGVPLIFVNLLGAEGASGSAFVDGKADVVGILQQGLGGKDVLGERTAGVVLGIDLSAIWTRSFERAVCHAYPRGGILTCDQFGLLTRVQAAALGNFALARAGDFGSPRWFLQGTGPIGFGGACRSYDPHRSVLFARKRRFTRPAEEGTEDTLLTHAVIVFKTVTEARDVFRRRTSAGNLSCFASEIQADVEQGLNADETLTGLRFGVMSSPPIGDGHAAAYIKWQIADSATGESSTGVLYALYVRAGNLYHGFQMISYDGSALFPDLTAAIERVVARSALSS
jgi:hypothetical protein